MRSNLRICAGIVSYNPSLSRIIENIRAISLQVEHIFVFDNGSDNIEMLESSLLSCKNVEIIKHGSNAGIAYALNRLCEAASRDSFSHIVTLDQDSVSVGGMVAELSKYADSNVGIVAPQILDRNKEDITSVIDKLDHCVFDVREAARKGVITSGCLTNLSAFDLVGGFDESYFIDYVDYDFNKRLLMEGYKIIRDGDTALIHECGHLVPTWLWTPRKGQDGRWRMERFYSFGHSPFRCYYKSRNRILYSKKYGPTGNLNGFEGARQIPVQVLLTIVFESEKKKKLRSFVKGIRDGMNEKVEPYQVKNAKKLD